MNYLLNNALFILNIHSSKMGSSTTTIKFLIILNRITSLVYLLLSPRCDVMRRIIFKMFSFASFFPSFTNDENILFIFYIMLPFFCSRHLFIRIGAIISQQGKTRLNKISVCSKWTSFVIKCVISFVFTHSTPTLAGRFIDVDFVHVFVLIPPVMELLIQFLIEFVDVLLTIFNHSSSLRRSFFITLFLSEFSLIIIKVHLINHSWNNCSPFRWKCSLKKSVLLAKCYSQTHTHKAKLHFKTSSYFIKWNILWWRWSEKNKTKP